MWHLCEIHCQYPARLEMQFSPVAADFDEFSLSDMDLVIYAIHTCSLFILWFCVSLFLFPDDSKRMSWAVSLLNSLVMSVASVFYMYMKLPAGFFMLASYRTSVFHGQDNFSATICLCFGVANVMDLLLGAIFYRDRLKVLTSLVHHPMFAFIAYYSITGNFFGWQMSPFSQGFMWMMIEEIPTFLLALGSIFAFFRSDLLFGITFFLFRILFHGYGTSYAILSKTDTPICVFMCISMVMHVIWFKQWMDSYRRPKRSSGNSMSGATPADLSTPSTKKPPRKPFSSSSPPVNSKKVT